jgi:predicted heme/steroid binding protein
MLNFILRDKVVFVGEARKVTKQELEENNGKNGKPAYFAYQGKVYDVSQSGLWTDGDHLGMHEAGKDLTGELEAAPHREENLARVKYVGELV